MTYTFWSSFAKFISTIKIEIKIDLFGSLGIDSDIGVSQGFGTCIGFIRLWWFYVVEFSFI